MYTLCIGVINEYKIQNNKICEGHSFPNARDG